MATLIAEWDAICEPDVANVPPGVGPRPIFIVGALRSGASLLTLALGQHPHFFQTLETGWFERFSLGLQQAYTAGVTPRETAQLDIASIELEEFFAHFGEAIDRLMLRSRPSNHLPATRWLDGSNANATNLFHLLQLFPAAKVIHVMREAEEVVATLTDSTNRRHYKTRQILMTDQEAADQWLAAVSAAVETERAFGSQTVLRVWRRDLVGHPEETIRRCLAFLDEPFDPACLRPFRSAPDETGGDSLQGIPLAIDRSYRESTPIVPSTAALMSKLLYAEGSPTYPRDEIEISRLAMAVADRCARETRALAAQNQAGRRGAAARSTRVATSRRAHPTNHRFGRLAELSRFVRAKFGG